MAKWEPMDRSLQENLLTLLCFDDDACRIIKGSLEWDLFESIYGDIARRAFNYIDQYGKAPKDHLPDILTRELQDENTGILFKDILVNLFDIRDGINRDYVLSRLSTFVQRQELTSAILEGAEILRNDGGSVDEARAVLQTAMKADLTITDTGMKLSDKNRALGFIRKNWQDEEFFTGIEALDKHRLAPHRKELSLFMALIKRGKTWWLTNLGKMALLARKRVLHITLEMSEEWTALRYYQSLWAIARDREEMPITYFHDLNDPNPDRSEVNLYRDTIVPDMAWLDHDIESTLGIKMDEWGTRMDKLVIKEFPTAKLTIDGLEAFLDILELQQNFIPDLLILDYPELMTVDVKQYRLELGNIYRRLRGIGVERNMAVCAVSQSNREGMRTRLISEGNASEDFSKTGTADNIISYNQTKEEKALGLARLHVVANRHEQDKFSVLVSQNYRAGQFVVDSVRMPGNYWDMLGDEVEMEHGDDDVESDDGSLFAS